MWILDELKSNSKAISQKVDENKKKKQKELKEKEEQERAKARKERIEEAIKWAETYSKMLRKQKIEEMDNAEYYLLRCYHYFIRKTAYDISYVKFRNDVLSSENRLYSEKTIDDILDDLPF